MPFSACHVVCPEQVTDVIFVVSRFNGVDAPACDVAGPSSNKNM